MVGVDLHRERRATYSKQRCRRLDLHCSGRSAGNIAGDDGQGSPPHIGEHGAAKIGRVELEFRERDLTVGAGRKDGVVDKGETDGAVGTRFDDVLDEELISDTRRTSLARPQY